MIARKALLITISTLITNVLGIASAFILAKMWGESSVPILGGIGFSLSIIALFTIFGDLGFSSAHVKRISEGQDIGTCIGTFALIKILLGGLSLLIILMGIIFWKALFGTVFTDATTAPVFILILLYTLMGMIMAIPRETFLGKNQIAKKQIMILMESLAKFPALIIVVLAGVTGAVSSPINWGVLSPLQRVIADNAASSVAMTYVIGMSAALLAGLWLIRKYPIKRPDLKLLKNYSIFAIPVTLSTISIVLATNIDRVMIGFYWSSVEVGYYFVVQRITGIISILSLSVSTILFPTISKYHSNNDMEQIKNTTRLSERYISMVLIPPVIFTIIFSKQIINVMLDEAYLPAAPVLVILAIWLLIRGLSLPYTNLLLGMDKPKIIAILSVAVCFANVGLNLMLIPKYGATGAGIATATSTIILFLGARASTKRLTKIKLLQHHTPIHLISGIIMGIVLNSLFAWVEVFHWYHLFIYAVFGLLIYVAMLFAFREFKKEDMKFYVDLLQPKKMINYVRDELKENT